MKTYKRICIKDYEVYDKIGNHFKAERGKEYITSDINDAPAIGPESKEDSVIVFSNYWVPVPIEIFAGEIKFT